MRALVIGAIDDDPGGAGLAHFTECDFPLTFHRMFDCLHQSPRFTAGGFFSSGCVDPSDERQHDSEHDNRQYQKRLYPHDAMPRLWTRCVHWGVLHRLEGAKLQRKSLILLVSVEGLELTCSHFERLLLADIVDLVCR